MVSGFCVVPEFCSQFVEDPGIGELLEVNEIGAVTPIVYESFYKFGSCIMVTDGRLS